ncbi:hydantoinase/oxoprolinase family protein [Methanohalophilus portucalensis]|uniref:Hydantoinase/oxoprolinase n=2 Tax=Methanohalophilus portucalensis TaxID=39664 RepID=A0A1L9C4L7_9EURY|nr:hydantoinase/oxoprolinase family protein [Methanohalophilus portucalensis]ATU07753.1 hydantoinase [Methanohalophilus portucalensis]OJH49437.1 hydantoinase/oxoprolinase [Methanohalophilus portucalensis FDF-1]RNI11464.1 hydantoinase/oxoprolinase family protein [Methanohalophilus portucalensis FDF-1]SMH40939.1 N-methylhydantoinase A/oxoprolinase/acetone carboxylase, beta subunit [Methanohalophilus portucalensis FDF-1]
MYLGLGIDTGGTYTDSIIMDISSGNVMDACKSLTTHSNLIQGIENSIEGLNASYLENIEFVSVSTTLATNTTLEENGHPAALILIGHSINGPLSTDQILSIKGGHDADGNVAENLDDPELIENFVMQNKDKVSSFAVSSYFGVRNPEHEMTVKGIIGKLTDKPVVCGHELSMNLGAYERAVTALLNAQLIPVTDQFIRSILSVMEKKGIDADLMMMKCDGSLVRIEDALKKPVESIFSGPAASLVGASHLSNLKTCLTMDVGGTSTDVSMISNGIPEISESGAKVGGWSTMVKAIKMDTSALGGDSHVWVQTRTTIGSNRVIPLCLAAYNHPALIEILGNVDKPNVRLMDNIIQPTTFFIKSDLNKYESDNFKLDSNEKRILDVLDSEPLSLYEISNKLDEHILMFSSHLESLVKKKYVQQIGFTPTDALHVLRDYTGYNTEASDIGAQLLGEYVGMNKDSFCSQIKAQVVKNMSMNIVSYLVEDIKKTDIEKMIESSSSLNFKVNQPIVLVGGPVKAYQEDICKILNADIRVPKYHEVGNAVGALLGDVIYRTESIVRIDSTGSKQYVVFSENGRNIFDEYEESVNFALDISKKLVEGYMAGYGLDMSKINLDVARNDMKNGYGAKLETKIVATGIGNPRR